MLIPTSYTSMTYSELVDAWMKELSIYPLSESESLIHWLLEHHLGLRRIDRGLSFDSDSLPQALRNDFERVKAGEPIQYIFRKGPFYGREFIVTPATLIPRNETEELVHLILKENRQANLKILDIGTGSGCIPITLDQEMNHAEVYGLDVSPEALEIAEQNNTALNAKVRFIQCDILAEVPPITDLDILVSNPPYVPDLDKATMHTNVLNHEPHLALFVPDTDPLVFYRRIGELGQKLLKPSGKIYFEIYEKNAAALVNLLQLQGYLNVRIHQDLNGKDRMCSATIS
jgi:release factor glutamine methyltransferase